MGALEDQAQTQMERLQRHGLPLRPKRQRAFNAASFGEALTKRLRGAAGAMLRAVNCRDSGTSASEIQTASWRRRLFVGEERGLGALDVPGAHTSPAQERIGGLPPFEALHVVGLGRTAARPAERAATAAVTREAFAGAVLVGTGECPAPSAAGVSVWDVSHNRGVGSCARQAAGLHPVPGRSLDNLRLRSRPVSYSEYFFWLQKVMPDCTPEPADLGVLPQGKDDNISKQSGLDLLHATISKIKKKMPVKTSLNMEKETQTEETQAEKATRKQPSVLPLTLEEATTAEDALGGGKQQEVLVSRFSVDLTREKIQCLRPATWLNDEVINFYFKLLQERCKRTCWFPNSFFWPKLSSNTKEYSFKEVRRWTTKAKVDIFALDHVVFPMNISDTHWALGVIDLKEKGFRYFDSMFCKPHKNFVPFLRRYVEDEHKAKKGGALEGVGDWPLIKYKLSVPQQRNGYDCGVFTCFFADYFAAGQDMVFTQDDMPMLRLRLASRVVNADENWPGS